MEFGFVMDDGYGVVVWLIGIVEWIMCGYGVVVG